jgi:hypothetical protein
MRIASTHSLGKIEVIVSLQQVEAQYMRLFLFWRVLL